MRTIVQVSCTVHQYSTVQYGTVQCSAVQYSTVQYSTVQCTNEDHCAGVLDTEVLAARAHQQRHHLHRYNSTLLQLHNLNTHQYSDIRRTRLLAPSLCAF